MTRTAQQANETAAIRAYLRLITEAPRPRRPVDLDQLDRDIAQAPNQLRRLQLIQAKLEATTLAVNGPAIDALEEAFVKYAGSYGKRKGISYAAWREVGVPASMLARAGIERNGQ